jgi:hypothetical protein
VVTAALLVDERLPWLLHQRLRGMLSMDNGKGSEDNSSKGEEESKGFEGGKGKGDKGDDRNFPKGGGGRRWTQQLTKY